MALAGAGRVLIRPQFLPGYPELGDAREAIRFYTNQAEKHWNQYSLISKGEIALLMHRNGKRRWRQRS